MKERPKRLALLSRTGFDETEEATKQFVKPSRSRHGNIFLKSRNNWRIAVSKEKSLQQHHEKNLLSSRTKKTVTIPRSRIDIAFLFGQRTVGFQSGGVR